MSCTLPHPTLISAQIAERGSSYTKPQCRNPPNGGQPLSKLTGRHIFAVDFSRAKRHDLKGGPPRLAQGFRLMEMAETRWLVCPAHDGTNDAIWAHVSARPEEPRAPSMNVLTLPWPPCPHHLLTWYMDQTGFSCPRPAGCS